ncbi:unnamed protein product, partial [Ectocarpus sp. 4 AP-2014]
MFAAHKKHTTLCDHQNRRSTAFTLKKGRTHMCVAACISHVRFKICKFVALPRPREMPAFILPILLQHKNFIGLFTTPSPRSRSRRARTARGPLSRGPRKFYAPRRPHAVSFANLHRTKQNLPQEKQNILAFPLTRVMVVNSIF